MVKKWENEVCNQQTFLSDEKKIMSETAKQALKEAEERRRQQREKNHIPEKEIGGRDGPDPVRYNDWEKNGIVSDF